MITSFFCLKILFFNQRKQLFHFDLKEPGQLNGQDGGWHKFTRFDGVDGFSGYANVGGKFFLGDVFHRPLNFDLIT